MFGISFGPKSVTATEAHELLKKEGACLLDVRTEDEAKEMSVPGSVNIPLDRLEAGVGMLSGYSAIYVMCRGGVRSLKGTKVLHQLGYKQAINMKGGILAWQVAEFPLRKQNRP